MIDPKALGDCGGCSGDIPGIAESIVQASKFLVNGHLGLSELYKQLASSAATLDDNVTFTKQAEKHARMARETAEVSVPDVGGNDGTNSGEDRNGRRQGGVEHV